jgi:hypothetical protein
MSALSCSMLVLGKIEEKFKRHVIYDELVLIYRSSMDKYKISSKQCDNCVRITKASIILRTYIPRVPQCLSLVRIGNWDPPPTPSPPSAIVPPRNQGGGIH